jgi:hypothetical protein
MVHDDSVIGSSVKGYSLAHSSVQWIFGVFPPDRVLSIPLSLRLPRIGEWMGEPQEKYIP